LTFAEERALGARAQTGRGAAAGLAAAQTTSAVSAAKIVVSNLNLSVTEKDMKVRRTHARTHAFCFEQ
jgi:hypothetical protein